MMTGSRVYNRGVNDGDSKLSVMLQSQRPSSSSPLFGFKNMMSFEDMHRANGSNKSFLRPYDFDEDLDDCFHQPEKKKRRLTDGQAKFLEKCFDDENKLEPERKIQLAKELGLQPRQIAIWFQNRRARWKTKRLEKDYGSLQASYNNLKADYESLVKENDILTAQARLVKDKLLMKDKEKRNPELSSDIISTPVEETPRKAVSDCLLSTDSGVVACKQEDMSSAIFNSDTHSSVILEAGDLSYVFEHDQSDEEDNLSKSLFHTYTFPKVEDVDYSDLPTSSCNFGFAAEEDHAFWSWSCL